VPPSRLFFHSHARLQRALALVRRSRCVFGVERQSNSADHTQDALFLATFLCSKAVASAPLEQRNQQIAKALDLYHETRHTRGRDVQRTSREAGLLYEFCGVGGEADDMEKLAKNLDSRMRWIWQYDVEGELKRAVASL
jgi:salicylate hydroxylase